MVLENSILAVKKEHINKVKPVFHQTQVVH